MEREGRATDEAIDWKKEVATQQCVDGPALFNKPLLWFVGWSLSCGLRKQPAKQLWRT